MEPTEDLPGERDGDLPETRPGEEPDGPGPGERAGDGDAPGGAGERHRDVSEPLVFLLAAGEVARREGEREAGRSEDDDSNDAELVRRRACRPATPNILLLHHRYLRGRRQSVLVCQGQGVGGQVVGTRENIHSCYGL